MLPNQQDPNYLSALLAGWGPIHEATDAEGRWLIRYNFMTYPEVDVEPAKSSFQALSEYQRDAVRQALGTLSEYINVSFVEVAEGGDLSFGSSGMPTGVGAYTYPTLGDIFYDRDESNWSPGSWQYQTIIHEIGHALGLDHPGDYNGPAGQWVDNHFSNPEAVGNTAYTLMSYQDYGTHYAVTPMLYDVAALQHLYGAASGPVRDDSYRLSIDGEQKGRFTIYDNGGNDTLYADSQRPMRVDLAEGHFSRFLDDGEYAFSIAYGTAIENAIGSPFDDELLGNGLANLLDGDAGLDRLSGGGGADVFRFSERLDSFRNDGRDLYRVDRILDFTPGSDRIDVSALGYSGLGSGHGGTLDVELNAAGTQTWLRDLDTDAAGNRFEIVLEGNHLERLTAANLIFATASASDPAQTQLEVLGTTGTQGEALALV